MTTTAPPPRRRHRRRPRRRRRDRHAARPRRSRRARRRPQPLRRRHPLHPRADARRRPPAAPLGSARRRSSPRARPPMRRTTFRYADDVVPITIKPSHGVDALYAPRRTLLDPSSSTPPRGRRRGALRHGSPTSPATSTAGSTASGPRRHGDRCAAPRRWVVGADGIRRRRPRRRRRRRAARHGRHRRRLRLLVRTRRRRLRVVLPARRVRRARSRPTTASMRVRRATPARIGRGGIDVLHDVVAAASPELADRLADAAAPDGVRSFGGVPATSAGPGSGLGAGRRRRLLEGPDQRARHHRRPARRRAARRAPHRAAPARPTRSRASRTTTATRDRLRCPLFDVVDTIAGMRWTDAEIPDCCCSSARR